MDALYKERFLRNMGIMDEQGLARIKATSIAVGGLGLGGSIFIDLVRMGFEKFHIADPDVYERTNVNRQRLAKESTIGVRKDDALLKEARDINPAISVKVFPEGVNETNVSAFHDGMDWVVDVVDVFAIKEKLVLNAEAHRRKIPVASCGAIGFSASVIIFDERTPSFAELTGMDERQEYAMNIERFIRFICPEVPPYMKAQMDLAMKRESHIPFIAPGVEISAAFAAAEIGKQVLGLGRAVRAPQGIHINPVELKIEIYKASYRARGPSTSRRAA